MLKNLSIIIPAYNEEHHLRACLDSIAAQTEPPEQVVVVDNNSTDATVAIAKEYPFVTLITAKDQGVVYARDAGFDEATGDIIGRIDADVRLPADWCRQVRQFYAISRHKNHAFTGGVRYYNIRLPRLGAWLQNQIVFRVNRLLLGHYILFGSNMAMPVNMWRAVRKDVCRRTDIHEDLDLSIHVHRAGYQVTYWAGLNTFAKMRRVRSEHGKLWQNMMLWPQTLKVHRNYAWPIAWVGALLLYASAPVVPAAERLAKAFGRAPLDEEA